MLTLDHLRPYLPCSKKALPRSRPAGNPRTTDATWQSFEFQSECFSAAGQRTVRPTGLAPILSLLYLPRALSSHFSTLIPTTSWMHTKIRSNSQWSSSSCADPGWLQLCLFSTSNVQESWTDIGNSLLAFIYTGLGIQCRSALAMAPSYHIYVHILRWVNLYVRRVHGQQSIRVLRVCT